MVEEDLFLVKNLAKEFDFRVLIVVASDDTETLVGCFFRVLKPTLETWTGILCEGNDDSDESFLCKYKEVLILSWDIKSARS